MCAIEVRVCTLGEETGHLYGAGQVNVKVFYVCRACLCYAYVVAGCLRPDVAVFSGRAIPIGHSLSVASAVELL